MLRKIIAAGVRSTLLASILPAASALSASAQEPDLTSMSLEDLTNLDVQTASLHAQSVVRAPGVLTVITAEEIHRNGYRTLAEALNHVVGFYVASDHTYSSVGVAGFSLPGDWATRILVLVNGHAMNDNIFGSANDFDDDFALDMSLVSRIEIVRGPSSSLYGSNGILATINVITKSPEGEHGTSIQTEADTLGEKKVTITQAVHLAGNSSLLLSGTAFNTTGMRDIYIQELNSPDNNNGHAVNMDGSRGYRFFADFKSGRWEILSLAGSREKIQPVSWADTVFNDRGTRATDQNAFVDVQYTRETDSGGSLRWRTYFDQYEFHGVYHYPLGQSATTTNGIDVNREFDAGDWVGSQLSYRFAWLRGNLTAGSELKFDLRALQSTADIQPVYQQNLYINKLDRYAAGFLQQEWNFGRRWSVNAGGRYDWSYYRSSSVSPRAAVVFEPDNRTSLKLLYGRGFRNPNANELFFNDGKQNEGNLRLQPERADTFQAEVERRLGHSWKADLSLYHVEDKGVIIPVYTADNLIQFQNATSFTGFGAAMELSGTLFSRLELSASFQKEKAHLGGQTPANSPGDVGKLRMSRSLFSRRTTLSAGLVYMSDRSTLSGAVLGPVYIPEATLSAKLGAGLDLRAGIRNISNFAYSDAAGLTATVDTLPQPGRTFFFTLTSHLRQ
jgi:iron complex outermembrane receptor protein